MVTDCPLMFRLTLLLSMRPMLAMLWKLIIRNDFAVQKVIQIRIFRTQALSKLENDKHKAVL